jgi:alanyl-tRNA synthetase
MGRAPTGKGTDGETWSIELCGGTHVEQTGDIGLFVTVGEGASSAGVRRVEALTGEAARRHLADQAQTVAEVAGTVRARRDEVAERVRALVEERKRLADEVADLRRQLALAGGGQGAGEGAGPEPRDVGGVPFLAQVLEGVTGKDLPGLIDAHKQRLGSGAILLIADAGGKAAVAAGVTDDLTARISAVDMVRAAVEPLGGKGGGGRPDLAQGGGRDAGQAEAAIAAAERVLQKVAAE